MTHTAQTESFGDYRIVIEPAQGYTAEDGIMTVSIYHSKRGLLDIHTDGMTLAEARDNAIYNITQYIGNSSTFYMGYDEVTILGLHNDKVLLKDSSDYIVASQTAFTWFRAKGYADVRAECMSKGYKGFSKYFNKEDIHHMEELV